MHVRLHTLLNTVLDWDKRLASRSGYFIPEEEEALNACWIGGLLVTKVGLGTFQERSYRLLLSGIFP
jgi:hypothetical protein